MKKKIISREKLEKVFHEDNPEITKDDFQDKFDDYVMNTGLLELAKVADRA